MDETRERERERGKKKLSHLTRLRRAPPFPESPRALHLAPRTHSAVALLGPACRRTPAGFKHAPRVRLGGGRLSLRSLNWPPGASVDTTHTHDRPMSSAASRVPKPALRGGGGCFICGAGHSIKACDVLARSAPGLADNSRVLGAVVARCKEGDATGAHTIMLDFVEGRPLGRRPSGSAG